MAQIKNHLREGRRADSSAELSHNERTAVIDAVRKVTAIEADLIADVK